MEKQHKILILDDDADWLELVRDLLAGLPSRPEILTATTAKRGLTLLESEPVRLLLCDLKMPRMDGLQVLTIVRRRHPELRTVVLSALEDEEFRSRAYALGVDMFWLKMEMQRHSAMFLECLESLLGRDDEPGFRGLQSKSLLDIIQMECLSRSSTVLRITRGPLAAKLWIQDGELVDAEAEGARGEAAFRRILGWKSGTFENLPAEPRRERTILKPINALLLETAQTLDEAADAAATPAAAEDRAHRKTVWKLSLLAREGAEFVIAIPPDGRGEPEAIGATAVGPLVQWTRHAAALARQLGERLEAGPVLEIGGQNLERQLLVLEHEEKLFLVAWPADAEGNLVEKTRKLVASWNS
jgi:CheY-like chemotaxis protein